MTTVEQQLRLLAALDPNSAEYKRRLATITARLIQMPFVSRLPVLKSVLPELPTGLAQSMNYRWLLWARPTQLPPDNPWNIWLLLAGRGFGKTRTGAEWVRARVESGLSSRIALVARSPHEVRDIMIQGESGILSVCPPWNMPTWESTKRRLTWPNGATAFAFSSYEPDQLRGPQFDAAWCDELASWQYPQNTWDNLAFGLRLGADPRCVVTTTPKPLDILRELTTRPDVKITQGSTYDNTGNLTPAYINHIHRYEGTQTGLQEIYAQLLKEADGALWKREWIDRHRIDSAPEDIEYRVVAIDPAVTFDPSRSDETGIIVAGMGPPRIRLRQDLLDTRRRLRHNDPKRLGAARHRAVRKVRRLPDSGRNQQRRRSHRVRHPKLRLRPLCQLQIPPSLPAQANPRRTRSRPLRTGQGSPRRLLPRPRRPDVYMDAPVLQLPRPHGRPRLGHHRPLHTPAHTPLDLTLTTNN